MNAAKSGALYKILNHPSVVGSAIYHYRRHHHNIGNSTASLSSTSTNRHFSTPASMSHDALEHISTAIVFAPVTPLLLGYMIPSSCYLWIVQEETLQTLWKLLAVLSMVFRTSAGSESLRIMVNHSNSRLFYSLSLEYMLKCILPARIALCGEILRAWHPVLCSSIHLASGTPVLSYSYPLLSAANLLPTIRFTDVDQCSS